MKNVKGTELFASIRGVGRYGGVHGLGRARKPAVAVEREGRPGESPLSDWPNDGVKVSQTTE